MIQVPKPGAEGRRFDGRLIAVSVSEVQDLARLGFPEDQMDRVLQALLVPLVSEGAGIAYGGRIEHPHNFTLRISVTLGETYRRLEEEPGHRPFAHFVAQHRFVDTDPAVLHEHLRKLAPYGEIRVTGNGKVLAVFAALDRQGPDVAAWLGAERAAGEAPDYARGPDELTRTNCFQAIANLPLPEAATSFTHMRRQMAAHCDARVQVGGRTTGFNGAISGLCEEALLTLEAGKPLLVLGGFGGASRDIAIALGLMEESECVPAAAAPDRDRYERGLTMLEEARPRFEALWDPSVRPVLEQLARNESLVDVSEQSVHLLARRLPPVQAQRP